MNLSVTSVNANVLKTLELLVRLVTKISGGTDVDAFQDATHFSSRIPIRPKRTSRAPSKQADWLHPALCYGRAWEASSRCLRAAASCLASNGVDARNTHEQTRPSVSMEKRDRAFRVGHACEGDNDIRAYARDGAQ
jgi:hypothetical protein